MAIIADPEKDVCAGNVRRFREEGRAPTEAEIGRTNRKEYLYLREKGGGKVTHWYPCAERKSYERGAVFVFRMMPAVEAMMRDGREFGRIVPGRGEEGNLHPNMIRRAGVIENFGSTRQVCFIPSLPYIPEHQKYERYASPQDNPYALLRRALWEKGSRLKKEWFPLIMSAKEIDAYRVQEKMKSTLRSEPFLPLVRQRFFAYAQIYNGYNSVTNEEFVYEEIPYGGVPDDGLQVVSFNEQVYQALVQEYGRRDESSDIPDRFSLHDPADPDRGPLNYIWNPKFPNPVSGSVKKGVGYDATVSCRFFGKPKQGQAVDFRLPTDFWTWYIENRLPWSSLLKGTYGVDQVYLLARAFPELKGPAGMAWDHHPLLMEAWENAFDGPADYDFLGHLHGKYGEDQEADETDEPDDVTTKRRKPVTAPPSRLRKEPPERRETVRSEVPPWKREPAVPEEPELDPLGEMPFDETPFAEPDDVDPDFSGTVTTRADSVRSVRVPLAGRAGAVTRPGTDRIRSKSASRRQAIESMRLRKEDFEIPCETGVATGTGADPDDTEENVF